MLNVVLNLLYDKRSDYKHVTWIKPGLPEILIKNEVVFNNLMYFNLATVTHLG